MNDVNIDNYRVLKTYDVRNGIYTIVAILSSRIEAYKITDSSNLKLFSEKLEYAMEHDEFRSKALQDKCKEILQKAGISL